MKLRKFIRGEHFHFQMLDDSGNIILASQAYTSKDARDNGIDSVKKNIGDPDRYDEITEGGQSFFILKAGNNQEIARSIGYTDSGAMAKAKSYALGRSKGSSDASSSAGSGSPNASSATPAAQPDGGEAYGTDGKDDDYKPLNFYVKNGSGLENGFDSFAAAGESYFSYSLDGSIQMISEGYKSDSARDNGINSVTKNMVIEARYQRKQHPNGKHFFNLNAGNNQEIATSAWFDSEGEMNGVISRLLGGSDAGSASTTVQGIAATEAVMSEVPKKKKKSSKPKKPKAEKVYLANGKYHDTDITYQLFRSGNDKHYFTFRNAEEKTILLNSDVRGFETQEQGQAKIDKVLEFGPDRGNYESKTTKNDKFYYYLKDTDGNNIAKSFFFKTEDEMEAAIGSLLLDTAAASRGSVDEYLECSSYEAHMGSKSPNHDDFIIFSQDDEHYFAMVGEGKVILRSEGYTTEKSRDNGIESVSKNREIEERYSVIEEDGSYLLILKAGNHQEIGRGCPKGDRAGAMYWMPSEINSRAAAAAKKKADEAAAAAAALAAKKAEEEAAAKAAAAAAAKKKAEEEAAAKAKAEADAAAAKKKADEEAAAKAKAKTDDYLACREYEAHISDVSADHKDFITFSHDGEHYFAWIGDGKIIMRSEGYGSESARDNGIASVIKNRELEERFSLDEKAGHYFTVLKAGNHQEIARSCPHKDKTAAMYWYPSAISSRAAATAAAAIKVKAKSDDYLACRVYESHLNDVSAEHKDFITFSHEGEHYFAWVADGKIVMRSEGYTSESARDNGIASVIKNREIEKRFSIDEKAGYFFTVLKAGNHQEIARSCPHKEKSAARAWFPGLAAAAVAVPLVAEIPKAAAPEPPKDKEDDYLPCKAYEGRTVNDKKNNVTLFKHEDGQYYFALYDNNGDVKLRSEGFRKAEERDEELSGVLKYHDDKDMYKRKEKGKYFMDILYDKTGREVGRSCLKKKEAPKAVPVAAAAVVAPKPIPKPEPKKVAAVPVKKKVVAAPVVEESGGFNWMWLLPLLLIPLLWFLLKGCGGETPPPPPPVKVEVPAPKPAPVPEPVKATPPPPPKPAPKPVAVAGCNCGEKGNIPIFTIPSSAAKSVSKLGTYPEFGNSHSLTPAQFYQKLSDRYDANAVDKTYLNYVFRSMGYRNGFAGASAGLFSNVTLDRGQKGLLGLGEQHHYEYSALNTNDRDRQAFKIKAANGCDVHFMKTCGNYMFFCD